MGKIRITESELRQMIQESILQEWGFDNRWQNKNANRENAYNDALRYYQKITSPDATGVTARDKRQAEKNLVRAIGRNGNQFANNIKNLQATNQELTNQNNDLQNQVNTLTQQVADYSQALTMISDKLGLAKQAKGALEEEAATQGQQMTNAQRIAQPALTAINKLQTALANARTQAQQQQKAQQQAQQQRAQTNAQMTQAISAPAKPMPQAPAAQPKAPQQGLKRG